MSLSGLIERLRNPRRHEKMTLSVEDLSLAVASSEKGFLAFGNDLQGFYDRAKKVSAICSSLISQMMGEQLNAQIRGLSDVSQRMKALEAESSQGTKALRFILEKAEYIQGHLLAFENVVRTLQVLCNFIRIESARFGKENTGFDTLSEDVRQLAGTIQEKTSTMGDHSVSLIRLARENLSRMSAFEQRQQDKGKLILESIMANLGAWTARHGLSSRKLSEIAQTWEGVSRSIGEIVASMQFHDITRQRLEHVTDALRDTAGKVACSSSGSGSRFAFGSYLQGVMGGNASKAGAVELNQTLRTYHIQSAQLVNARNDLVSAADRIADGLKSLVASIRDMSREAKEVTEVTHGTGASFLSEMEKAFSSLTKAVGEYTGVNREMAATVEQVASTISSMGASIGEITRIGIEMKMVALNAAIHAAHAGDEGLGLGVLAEAIHHLSQQTSKEVDSIAEALHSVFDHATDLKGCAALVSQEGNMETQRMVESLNAMLPSIRQANEDALRLLGEIQEAGDSLSQEMERSAQGVDFHNEIIHSTDALSLEIQEASARIQAALPEEFRQDSHPEEAQDLQEIEARYTMQKERDVLQAVAAVPNTQEAPLSEGTGQRPAEGTKAEENLGDNVELF